MKLGYVLPHIGKAASPQAIIQVAKRAEELGLDSLWVTERLLFPISPQTKYPGTPDGFLPEPYKIVIDPLQALALAAANTRRIGLGTSVLVMPYHNPVVLARTLTSLDVISGGRLRVGLGQGWSKDEHDAVGTPMKSRAGRADEFLEVLKAIWTTDPVEYRGKFFHIPRSIIQPKSVQKPHPPIYLAAYAPGATKRAATMADGWNPAGVPSEGMAQMMDGMRQMAKEAGRDPSQFKLVVRANANFTEKPLGKDRSIFIGSTGEVKSDLETMEKLGAEEVFFDLAFSKDGETIDGHLRIMQTIKQLVA